MKKMRKVYHRVFKEKAVHLSYERHNFSEVAREELSITAPQMYKWRKEYEEFGQRSFLGNGISSKRQSRNELLSLKENSKMQK